MVISIPLINDVEKFKIVIEIFARKGYYSTSMDEIAVAMGVAKGTLYYHYKNKEDLYYNAIKAGIEILEHHINCELEGTPDPINKIRKVIRAQLNFYNSYSDVAFIFLRELYGKNIRRDALSSLVERIVILIKNILREGNEAKIFQVSDLETASIAFFGAVSSTALHYINQKGDIKSEAAQLSLENIIFNGILNNCI